MPVDRECLFDASDQAGVVLPGFIQVVAQKDGCHFSSAPPGNGCVGTPIVSPEVVGTPSRRSAPPEPEPCCVRPWRPRPSLNGGAALPFPLDFSCRRSSHASQSTSQSSPSRLAARVRPSAPRASAGFFDTTTRTT